MQVLPAGWVKVVCTDDARLLYVKEEGGLLQAHPPSGTTLETVEESLVVSP
jgi:hypothetical protein